MWLDNTLVGDLSAVGTANLGIAAVGQFQIGDAQTARTYDVVFDDAAFGSARLGTAADGAAPSVPSGVSAVASSPFSVDVNWSASTDDVAVAGYDVLRDGAVIGSVDASTTRSPTAPHSLQRPTRTPCKPGTARTTCRRPAPACPSPHRPRRRRCSRTGSSRGTCRHGRRSAGLTVENTDVRTGTFAAEGNTTNGNTLARKTLGATYLDAYARVGFELKSQTSQVNLLRMRDAGGVSIGYLYVSTGGKLGFHDDALNTNTLSATIVGSGWHALELHLGISGATGTVEVWLDNVRIADLSNVGAANVGTSAVGQFQIGEAQTARTYDVVFDDAAFGSGRLGP